MYLIVTILLGFRYSASSIPLISSAGVAIGAGSSFNLYSKKLILKYNS